MAGYIEAIILGAVQGLTEFLPVSSSGHLTLLTALGVGEPGLFFMVMLHAGTLLSVIAVYAKKLVQVLLHPVKEGGFLLLLSSAITVAMIVFVKLLFPQAFDALTGGKWLGFSFILTSVLLVSAEVFYRGTKKAGWLSATLAGVFQGVSALLPGLSRSGSTVSAQTFAGVDRTAAADYSFLLSVPVIVGATLVEGKDLFTGAAGLAVDPWALLAGVATAFLTGVIAIKFFLKVIKNFKYYPFAIYTFALGIFSFVFLY